MLELTILRSAEDDATRARLTSQLTTPPKEERVKTDLRPRSGIRRLSPAQAAQIAAQAEEWDREVTGRRG